MTIYVLSGFNNYYNRIVKKFDTVEEYMPYKLHTQQNFNFVPNDSVNTQVVLGNLGNQYTGEGDYLLVVNEFNEIVSRWFVIENVRDRAGQYTLTLHRDLVADYQEIIMKSPMFIEKATVNQINDPAIFNRESLTFNQIKKSETFLKDETNCPWIVGYIPESFTVAGKKITGKYTTGQNADISVSSLQAFDGYQFYNGTKVIKGSPETFYYGYGAQILDSFSPEEDVTGSTPQNAYYFFEDGQYVSTPTVINPGSQTREAWKVFNSWIPAGWQGSKNPGFTAYNKVIGGSYKSNYVYPEQSYFVTGFNSDLSASTFKSKFLQEQITTSEGYQEYSKESLNSFKAKYDNKILLDQSTGMYYKIKVTKSINLSVSKNWLTQGTESFQYLDNNILKQRSSYYIINIDPKLEGTANNNTYFASFQYYTYSLDLEPVYKQVQTSIDESVYELNDQPYYMFCIPYTDSISVVGENGLYKYTFSKALGISLATGWAAEVGKENIFDIQVLPFCPARYAVNCFKKTPGWVWTDEENGKGHGGLDEVTGIDYSNILTEYIFDETELSGLYNPINVVTINNNTSTVGAEIGKIFWGTSGNFSFDIDYLIPTKDSVLETKIASETEVYRLCSPNYSGVFEFDPYMNNGVKTFNVDCSYKPFNPYIHINPVFGGLYGSDFNDQRGLIIQGDFSLPQETSAWAQYELNNKNYQQMFDRQIQNLKVNQDVQRKQQVFNAVTGTIMGGAGGAVMGAKGGPAGMIAGAAIGTIASTIGGALDVQYGDILRNEALDYTKDIFGYNLGNIQALPNGITKTSPLTANFKYFPFIEMYDCTEVEKQALRNKLKYNGMTIMRIGTLQEFYTPGSYVKGKLIRLETLNDDYHIVNALSGELDKGVFIQ